MERSVRRLAADGSYIKGVKETGATSSVPRETRVVPLTLDAAAECLVLYRLTDRFDGAGSHGEMKQGAGALSTETD